MNPPFFKTESLFIYAPCHRQPDVDSHVNWLNDKDVVKYSEQRWLTHTAETQWQYIKTFDNVNKYFWEIALRQSDYNYPIGTISADIDLCNGVADVGILIGAKKYWGCGLGSEAWQTVCDWLLSDRKLRKVEAGAMQRNKGMLAIFFKTGMKIEGIRVEHFMIHGKTTDMVLAGRFK